MASIAIRHPLYLELGRHVDSYSYSLHVYILQVSLRW